MKRQHSPVLEKLRHQRRTAARQISKINGNRDLIQWDTEEGDTWVASSYADWNKSYFRRLDEKELVGPRKVDWFERGWRPYPDKVTQPN